MISSGNKKSSSTSRHPYPTLGSRKKQAKSYLDAKRLIPYEAFGIYCYYFKKMV